MEMPRPEAIASSRASASKVRPADKLAVRLGALGHPEPGRERLAAAVLAGEPAAGERAEREVGDLPLRAQREQSRSSRALSSE
jgi:hypothetical protein